MKPILIRFLLGLLLINIAACKKNEKELGQELTDTKEPDPGPVPTPELIFNTGFENSTYMVYTGAQTAEFRGLDATYNKSNDWVTDLANHTNIGYFRIYYEQGDSTQRLAKIVTDPVNPLNNVLHYKISVPHIDVPLNSQYTVNGILFDQKARIQADLYGNNGLREIYQSIRLYLPTDYNKLVNSTYPGTGDWLTLFEFWNNEWWSANYTFPFRFGINLEKGTQTVGSPLYFKAEGQKLLNGKITQVWLNKNISYPVPIGKWMTLEYYIKEGNKGTGQFYFAITPDGGTKTVIFNLKTDTCHPDDPAPNGLSELNPIKLYTSNNLVNQMNNLGGKIQCYWDDFKLWKNKRP